MFPEEPTNSLYYGHICININSQSKYLKASILSTTLDPHTYAHLLFLNRREEAEEFRVIFPKLFSLYTSYTKTQHAWQYCKSRCLSEVFEAVELSIPTHQAQSNVSDLIAILSNNKTIYSRTK